MAALSLQAQARRIVLDGFPLDEYVRFCVIRFIAEFVKLRKKESQQLTLTVVEKKQLQELRKTNHHGKDVHRKVLQETGISRREGNHVRQTP